MKMKSVLQFDPINCSAVPYLFVSTNIKPQECRTSVMDIAVYCWVGHVGTHGRIGQEVSAGLEEMGISEWKQEGLIVSSRKQTVLYFTPSS